MKKTKKGFGLAVLILSLLLGSGSMAAVPSRAAAEGDGGEVYESISLFNFSDYSPTTMTLSWYSDGNNDGFNVYRASEADKEAYELVGTVKNERYEMHSFTDKNFKRGIRFYYAVVAYHCDADGTVVEGGRIEDSIKIAIPKTTLRSVSRSGKNALVKWKKVEGVSGYQIYRKTGDGSYKKAKTVTQASAVETKIKNISQSKQVAFKVRAYVSYQGKKYYGAFGTAKFVYSKADRNVAAKFKMLMKKFPNGRYWNHAGKKKYSSDTVTKKPCNHASLDDLRTCNHYNCPNGVLGYQCYGFAWKMSDLIYGKNAGIKNFTGFAKCRMGDVVRYGGHSIIIVEKHKNYVIAGECNYGNTCRIVWGRKVTKAELRGASYSRRS